MLIEELNKLYEVVEQYIEPNARKDYCVAYGKLKSFLKIYELIEEVEEIHSLYQEYEAKTTDTWKGEDEWLYEKSKDLIARINDFYDLEEDIEEFLDAYEDHNKEKLRHE